MRRALTCTRLVAQAVFASARRPQQFVTACAGFPKDLLYGPSTVLRKDSFGDDACFVARHHTADVVGVADGVGGWRTYGIDPSNFSRSLMRTCARLVVEGRFNPKQPALLIADSYKEMLPHREQVVGSSTACLVVFDKQRRQIHTANLGDSGFLVVRRGKIVHRSSEQQHYFNTPFQLSLPPDPSNDFLSDQPDAAETASFDVEDGDVILVATDGLFDNMPEHLIENELKRLEKDNLQQVANSIAFQARRLAFDRGYMSPFAKKAQEHGIEMEGGKPDDITVILAVISAVEE